jgi:hypothetical protein
MMGFFRMGNNCPAGVPCPMSPMLDWLPDWLPSFAFNLGIILIAGGILLIIITQFMNPYQEMNVAIEQPTSAREMGGAMMLAQTETMSFGSMLSISKGMSHGASHEI